MKLFIAIVNYKVPHLVTECLHSLVDELPSVPGTRVAVCENNSGDNSSETIEHAIEANRWSWCTLKVLDTNLGFTGGNNVLIRPALDADDPPDFVLMLNPDTVVRPGALSTLVQFMDQNPKVGVAGSRLEDPDGTPQRSAFRFQTPLGSFDDSLRVGTVSKLLRRWVVAPPVVNDDLETDWVSGASMIVRRQVFDDIGLLDQGFFTYFDDIDFCFNARKRGWSVWYVPKSRVVHLVGQSSGINNKPRRLPSYVLDARRRYFLKNHGPLYAALVDFAIISGLCLSRMRIAISGRTDNRPPHLLLDSIRHSVFAKGFRVTDVKLTKSFSSGS